MNFATLLLSLSLVCMGMNIIMTMVMVSRLQAGGVKINYFLIRLLYPKYVHQYKTQCVKKSGQVPKLFYGWLATINGSAVLAISGMFLLATK